MAQMTRRRFLEATAASAPAWSTFSFASARAARSVSEGISVGLIGCGGRGKHLAERFQALPGVRLSWVCDPDESRLAEVASRFGVAGHHATSDPRRILDDAAVDAVVIATPDHWHAPAAILACDAGKHVYVEKPCAHNFREGQLLVEAARRNHRVVQHGTQSRSNPFIQHAISLLHEGIIGEVLVAKAWNVQRRKNIGKAAPSPPPPGFDYDMWAGPAEKIPFRATCHHYTWHWWYPYGTGDLGNDGVHELDYARWGLGTESLPAKVTALGGKYFHDDDQQFPDTQTVAFEYPKDNAGHPRQLIFEMRLWSTNYPRNVDGGVEYYGTQGMMFLSKRGKLQIWGERNQPREIPSDQPPLSSTGNHQLDFVSAIRDGHQPSAEIEIGFHSSALCHLGNVATRLGRVIHLDPDTQAVQGDDEAQAALTRRYREGGHWAIPQGV